MTYSILIYCPDQHIQYRADTPDTEGVGGGVTARIRLAQALAGLGHQVIVLSHVPEPHTSQGATFLPLDQARETREVDVLLLTTSGGGLNLEPALSLPVMARLREVWVHGTIPVKGLEALDPDRVVAVSNFIRRVARDEWGLGEEKLAVIHNGFHPYPGLLSSEVSWERDPYALVYTSHPSKGLQSALKVLRRLRKRDDRYTLHVYGGYELWGEKERAPDQQLGVIYHGMVGQRDVARALRTASYSLHLQSRLEPFALSLVEALGYGCIPIVSPVGGNREAVRHGVNGMWVEGDHESRRTQRRAAEVIHALTRARDFSVYLRTNARSIPWTWENQARVWAAHWERELGEGGQVLEGSGLRCSRCGGRWLLAADGYHCTGCGYYSLEGSESG